MIQKLRKGETCVASPVVDPITKVIMENLKVSTENIKEVVSSTASVKVAAIKTKSEI